MLAKGLNSAASALTVLEVLEAALFSQDENGANGNVRNDCCGAHPPDRWVTNQVDLAMFLDPEVLSKGLETSMEQHGEQRTMPLLSLGHESGRESYV